MSAVWIISGTVGAGKTTVSRALCQRYAAALHIPLDDVREWVCSGYANPIDPGVDPHELKRQFVLARSTVSRMAVEYAAQGFAVVIDDVVGMMAREGYEPAFAAGARRVLLLPRLEIAIERNRTRTTKAFDTSVLEPWVGDLHAHLSEPTSQRGWTVIDSSALTVEETVDAIIARCGL